MRPVSLGPTARSTAILAPGARGCEGRGMSYDTSGTSSDPELDSEGDTDQLSSEDTLLDRGVDDLLDEGYSVPTRGRAPTTTARRRGKRRTARRSTSASARRSPRSGRPGELPLDDREQFRAGRLVEDDDAVAAGGTDGFAIDAGISGGAASAEEAAVHLIAEEYVDERRYHDDDDEV